MKVRWLIALLCLAYLGYGVAMIWLHPKFVYPFRQDRFDSPQFEQVTLENDEGSFAVYRHEGRHGAPVVVYFMGNAGSLHYFKSMLDHHAAKGRWVIAMGYRGGGGLEGVASERVLKADARSLLDALPELTQDRHGPVVIQGYSLGTGVAMSLASDDAVDGVILSAPYAKLCTVMMLSSGLPACWMPGVQKWDNLALVDAAKGPVLIFHGVIDTVVPYFHGRKLADALGSRVEFVKYPEAGHIDLIVQPDYLDRIDQFIAELRE